MRHSSIPDSVQSTPQETACPRCGIILVLEDLQSGARLFGPVASGLIDHLLHIETELAQIRRLLLEEVGL